MELTAIILTKNEEVNIGRTLEKLTSLERVLVIDSFSTDNTVEIATSFKNVSVFQREFDSHTQQWEYARSLVQTEWTLALDADYQFSEDLIQEIIQVIQSHHQCNGYFVNFNYAIDGRILKSGIYPPVCILYRTQLAYYEKDGHTQRLKINGLTRFLSNSCIHDDRKPFEHWVKSQLYYARLEAEKLKTASNESLSSNDKIRLGSKLTPILVFFYCIFGRRGFRDGIYGWKYAFQRMLAELLLQYYLLDRN
jgi:glycosyltransferase involved in cell wall biosynthesis